MKKNIVLIAAFGLLTGITQEAHAGKRHGGSGQVAASYVPTPLCYAIYNEASQPSENNFNAIKSLIKGADLTAKIGSQTPVEYYKDQCARWKHSTNKEVVDLLTPTPKK